MTTEAMQMVAVVGGKNKLSFVGGLTFGRSVNRGGRFDAKWRKFACMRAYKHGAGPELLQMRRATRRIG